MDPAPRPWSDVIAVYWRRMARAHAAWPHLSDDMTDFWAWEAVDSVWTEGVPQAIDKLVELADAAPNPQLLIYLGGGPLEDLVEFWGTDCEDEIVAAARRSTNFAAALRNVYSSETAVALWDRIEPAES